MIFPIEIFNKIAKYYVNSFNKLGIILSLSSEIAEYVTREEYKIPSKYPASGCANFSTSDNSYLNLIFKDRNGNKIEY